MAEKETNTSVFKNPAMMIGLAGLTAAGGAFLFTKQTTTALRRDIDDVARKIGSLAEQMASQIQSSSKAEAAVRSSLSSLDAVARSMKKLSRRVDAIEESQQSQQDQLEAIMRALKEKDIVVGVPPPPSAQQAAPQPRRGQKASRRRQDSDVSDEESESDKEVTRRTKRSA